MRDFKTMLSESAHRRPAAVNQQGVLEARRLLQAALGGTSTAKAQLEEAFTTSDFPHLLGQAFNVEARAAYREVVDETQAIAYRRGVPDFEKRKLKDIFGETYFERVHETEEYKSDNPFKETEVEFATEKWGRVYKLSWELFLSGDFSSLADFPGIIGRGAINTRNRVIYSQLVAEGAVDSEFFNHTGTAALSFDSLRAAKKQLVETENHRGDGPVDVSNLMLVVPPALEDTANALVSARTIKEILGIGNKTQTEVERSNPNAGIQVQVSHEFSRLLAPEARTRSWALLPGQGTANPALIAAHLNGHESVDIRVEDARGQYVGGGEVPFTEGSFKNDSIAYRGRYTVGAAKAFAQGTFASTGADEG